MIESKLDAQFKFRIGEIVRHKTVKPSEAPFLVVSRGLDECEGGVQNFYWCRQGVVSQPMSITPTGISRDLLRVGEVELERIP